MRAPVAWRACEPSTAGLCYCTAELPMIKTIFSIAKLFTHSVALRMYCRNAVVIASYLINLTADRCSMESTDRISGLCSMVWGSWNQ